MYNALIQENLESERSISKRRNAIAQNSRNERATQADYYILSSLKSARGDFIATAQECKVVFEDTRNTKRPVK